MRRRWLLAGGVSILIAGGAVAYGVVWRHQREETRARQQAVKQAAAAAQSPSEIVLPGKIQAKQTVAVAAPIEGTLDRYLVDVGDEVFEGEVLAHIKNEKLESAEANAQSDAERMHTKMVDLESALIAGRLEASRARADATRAKAEYDRTEKIYLRQKMLVGEGATPRLVFEKAERDYQIAKADYEGQEALAKKAEDRVATLTKDIELSKAVMAAKDQDLEDTKAQVASGDVRSPVNGVLVGRRGGPGDTVNPGMRDLLQIAVDLSSLEVVVDPDPRSASRIRQGQAALVQVAESPEAIQGTVREIKTGRVFIDFASPSPAIKPGLTAQVKFKLS